MKLTTTTLKRIIAEEVAKFKESKLFGDMESVEDVDADEVDADEFADSLEHHVDHYKALGLEEARLVKRLSQIQEAKKNVAKSVAAKKALAKKSLAKKALKKDNK
jgi:hypothetical protein